MKKAWVLSLGEADLSLHWAHTHFIGFVMSQLIFIEIVYYKLEENKKCQVSFVVKYIYFLLQSSWSNASSVYWHIAGSVSQDYICLNKSHILLVVVYVVVCMFRNDSKEALLRTRSNYVVVFTLKGK